MRRSKNVPRETLLELHASFLHPPVHHVQRVAKCFTRNTSNRDEVLRRRKIGQPRSGVFHVKQASIGRSEPPRMATLGASLAATSSISPNRTARDITHSKLSVTSSALVERTLTLGSFRVASRRKTLFRWCDSINVTQQLGLAMATGIPGNPAPEPISAIRSAPLGI